MAAPRYMARQWRVTEHDAHFEITDEAGLHLAVVYFDDEPWQQPTMKRMSKDGALRLARQIARLPVLLQMEKEINPGKI
jgi:hypothetical protein